MWEIYKECWKEYYTLKLNSLKQKEYAKIRTKLLKIHSKKTKEKSEREGGEWGIKIFILKSSHTFKPSALNISILIFYTQLFSAATSQLPPISKQMLQRDKKQSYHGIGRHANTQTPTLNLDSNFLHTIVFVFTYIANNQKE